MELHSRLSEYGWLIVWSSSFAIHISAQYLVFQSLSNGGDFFIFYKYEEFGCIVTKYLKIRISAYKGAVSAIVAVAVINTAVPHK